MVAIDHWCGSPEHQRNPSWKAMLPSLYETFIALCWDYRHRVIPLRMTTLQGLRVVASQQIAPDLIYIDAEHSYDALTAELELVRHLFPHAVVIGDDYDWAGVAPALADAAPLQPDIGNCRHAKQRTRWKLVASESTVSSVPEPGPEHEHGALPTISRLNGSLGVTRHAPLTLSPIRSSCEIDCAAVRAEPRNPRYLAVIDPTPDTGLLSLREILGDWRNGGRTFRY